MSFVLSSPQVRWSFDGAHPALAEQHYLRTKEQNDTLEQERAAAQRKLETARAAAAELRRRKRVQQQQCRSASPNIPAQGSAHGPERRRHPVGTSQLNGDSRCDRHEGDTHQSVCDMDISQIQHQSAEVAARAEQVLEHSLQLTKGCAELGLDVNRPCSEPGCLASPGPGHRQQQSCSVVEAALICPHQQRVQYEESSCAVDPENSSRTPPVQSGVAMEAESSCVVDRHRGDTGELPADVQQEGTSYAVRGTAGETAYTEAVASGKFTEDRYAEYAKGLEQDMQIRMHAGQEMGNIGAGACSCDSNIILGNATLQESTDPECEWNRCLRTEALRPLTMALWYHS